MTEHLHRRSFLTFLGGAAAAWPMAARAQQQPAMPVVGYLDGGAPETGAHRVSGFRKGLSEMGYVEGRNVAIEYRWAHDQPARQPDLASDLVRHRVAVIVASSGTATALVAKAATATIPIVFQGASDPVASGLVASFNRPGGNVTGIVNMGGEIVNKQLGLLHDLTPGATRFAALVSATAAFARSEIEGARAAAAAIGLQMETFTVGTSREIDEAFASLADKRVEALIVTPRPLFQSRRVQLVTNTVLHRLPVIYPSREFIEVGGLMSYGASRADQSRKLGIYVGRILKGEKPADLPVMQPTKFEFVINLQTARTLGLTVPPTLLAIADEVIE
jgi:putative tryptophan/tyrosine transport system substrate-binding protein